MRPTTTLALAILLVGCTSNEDKMLASVRAELKDPKSAEFSKLVMRETSDGTINVLCGMVNAKNSFGGYTGPQPFNVSKSKREDDAFVVMGEGAGCDEAMRIAEKVALERDKR